MSKRLAVLVLFLLATGLVLAQTEAAKPEAAKPNVPEAQKAEKVTDEAAALVKQVRDEIQKDRNAIVAAGMQLSEKDAAAFWPLYSEYRTAMKPVGERSAKLLVEYAKVWQTITNEQAAKLIEEWVAIQKLDAETKAAWVQKFNAKLPAKLVLRFFQIDSKLDTVIRFQLASEVPLAE